MFLGSNCQLGHSHWRSGELPHLGTEIIVIRAYRARSTEQIRSKGFVVSHDHEAINDTTHSMAETVDEKSIRVLVAETWVEPAVG